MAKNFGKHSLTSGEIPVIPYDLHPPTSVLTRHPSCYGAALFSAASKDAEFGKRGSEGRVNRGAECQFLFILSIHRIITRYRTNSPIENKRSRD